MKRCYKNPLSDNYFDLITDSPEKFPFAFTYGDKSYNGFPTTDFELVSREKTNSDGKVTITLNFLLDPTLKVSVTASHYPDYGVSEWTVWFENPGNQDSKIICDPKTCLDFEGERPLVKGIMGDLFSRYTPYTYDLSAQPVYIRSDRGRATHGNFPYFNLEYGDCGVMLAIGWAGTWKAAFDFDGKTTRYTANSVNDLRTYLKPGEKIRTALFVMANYTLRNEIYATNYWRSWYLAHNLPKADAEGNPLTCFSTNFLAYDTGLPNSDGSISERWYTWKPSMEKMLAEGLKGDFRWFDAGWYVTPELKSEEKNWSGTVGTWELDKEKWPGDTFLQSTEFAREHGMKTLMWFEPDRITHLYVDDLIKNFGYKREWALLSDDDPHPCNNIGDPECYEWTLSRITKTLRENRVELYREDSNCDMGVHWRHHDRQVGPGRAGITESKFILAHYRLWDDIIACTTSYGGCAFVDSCASGGGRNDLESMRRAVPLLRSDLDRTTTSVRLSMTTSLNRWLPFCGANTRERPQECELAGDSDMYIWRASYLPILNMDHQYTQDKTLDFDMLRAGFEEWKSIKQFLLKDFYVLTPWHTRDDNTSFTVFCYYDPDTSKGVMLAFRQERCVIGECKLAKLPFVEEGRQCILTDADTRQQQSVMYGENLILNFDHRRQARLLRFEVK